MDLALGIVMALLATVTLGAVLTAEGALARAWLRLRGLKDVRLDHYELAYLAGGPDRVAETAIGLLAREGRIRVSRGGLLHHVAGTPADRPPIEGRVLGALKGRRGGRSVAEVRGEVAQSPEVTAIQHRLGGKGLLVNVLPVPVVRVCVQVLRAVPILVAVAIVTFLVLMVVTGPSAAMVPSLVGLVVTWLLARWGAHLYKDRAVVPGRAGRYHLSRARRRYHRGTTGLAAPLVALYGLSHLGDWDLITELHPSPSPIRSSPSPRKTTPAARRTTNNSGGSGGGDTGGTPIVPSGTSCGGGGGGGCGGGCGGGD